MKTDARKYAQSRIEEVIEAMKLVKVRVEDCSTSGNTLIQCINQLLDARDKLIQEMEEEKDERQAVKAE